MAYIEPNTTVEFLTVPFDPDYENTMYWANETQQNLWMESKVIITLSRNSYQRKSRGVIRVGWTADLETPVRNSVIKSLYNSNYMRFKNTNYENKWFYAFVKQVEYINNNTVDVYYEIDVMQTWACDYQLLECFIERQHTITDDIGEHTVPEGLETGEYFSHVKGSTESAGANGYYQYTPAVCLVTTFDDQGDYAPGAVIRGQFQMGDMFSGLHYTVWDLTDPNSVTDINNTLEAISGNTKIIENGTVKVPIYLAEGVVALFMLPLESWTSMYATRMTFDIRTNGSYLIGSYRPRNKKLLCYPYNLLYITNNQGNDAEFRWEDFSTPIACPFDVWGNISPNGGLVLAPRQYKGYVGQNPDESMQLTGFPMCSWSNDAYKAWVAQNAGTLGASVVGLAAQWATAIANPATAILENTLGNGQSDIHGAWMFEPNKPVNLNPGRGLIGATLGAVGQVYDHKRKPPQSHGNGNTSLTYQAGNLSFFFYSKHIKEEYAEIIDAFLDMYGYKVNMVGVPNRNARPCWTYIKTIGCAVDGLIPADDAKQIQSIFDKGIRFWNSSATFGVYSPLVNNNEVTIAG